MGDIAVEAIRRLTELSKPGRQLAIWYEENDGVFFRPKELRKIPDDQPLTFSQLCIALNANPSRQSLYGVVKYYLKKHPFLYEKVKNNGGKITFNDLNIVSRDSLPKDFPFVNKAIGLKWSNALFCYRLNELHFKPVRPYELWMPRSAEFNSRIHCTKGRQTIFKRYGYYEPDGSEISITSHQFRHYLNTLAQKGAVGELDIAKWSGRANIHQNNIYNHMTDEDYIERAKSSEILASIGNPLTKINNKDPNSPVTVADLNAATKGRDRIAHVTEWGFCIHDFAFSPCQKCADCLNCSEQVCIKGDKEKLERLRCQRELLNTQLQNAIKADKQGTYGASRWADHQARTIERLDNLIEVLESDDVEDGAVIRLSSEYEDTPVKRFLGKDNAIEDGSQSSMSLEYIKKLLHKEKE